MIKDTLSNSQVNIKPSELIYKIKSSSNTTINYITTYKAIESHKLNNGIVLKDLYSYLNSFVNNIHIKNTDIILKEENKYFKYMFVTWEATKCFFILN